MGVDGESRREFLKKLGTVTSVVGVGAAGAFGAYKYHENTKDQTPFGHEEVNANPQADFKEAEVTLKKLPIEKVMRGEIQITKKVPVDGRMEALNIRRTPVAPEKHEDDTSVRWEDIKSINGVQIDNAVGFTMINAPLIKGKPVDRPGGNEYYWIQMEAELSTGEKTLLYISRSTKTAGHIYERGTKDEPIQKDAAGNYIEPYNGIGKVIVPSTSRVSSQK